VATTGNVDDSRSIELIFPRKFGKRVGMVYALVLRLVRSGDIPSLRCGPASAHQQHLGLAMAGR
jgi:hypothetical protein